MKKINYIELGGTLFVPATHKDLYKILNESKYPTLKSIVIDTEDAILEEQLSSALQKIQKLLQTYRKTSLLVFIRVRNIHVLKEILGFNHIQNIDGFLLPKFSLYNAKEYLDILQDRAFYFMPSIEGDELFSQEKLFKLRDVLLPYKHKVVVVRFGLEDMLRQFSLKRGCEDSLFDISAPSVTIGNFIATFKSSGFSVSGGVYPCYKDTEGFIKDVKRDLKEGLFSKTIIHPNHIELINELYKVSKEEYREALELLQHKEAIFAQNEKMAETTTMSPYAKNIILRREIYGICS